MTLLTAIAVFILDRVTKLVAIKYLAEAQSVKVVPGIFHITLVLNNGIAFGLLKGQRYLFISLSVIIIAAIAFYLFRNKTKTGVITSTALGLVLGGAVGNLVDRIRLDGYVIDFLDFRIWPVFNLADSAITIGAGLLVWSALRKKTS